VVEYILLLVVALGVAVLITNLMVSRGVPEGFVISSWKSLLNAVAADKADGVDP
jgi:ABC-type lipoprotein release transport system permease subunit